MKKEINAHPLPSKNSRNKEGKIKISVRLSPKVHAKASAKAKKQNMYLMDWVEALIVEALRYHMV